MTETVSTGTYTYVDPSCKKRELIERLIKENHITLSEGLMLMEKEVVYVPQSQPFTQPYNPYTPPYWYTTCKSGDAYTLTN